jgi:hypothetical protein
MAHFRLHVTENGFGGEEEYNYQTTWELDDMLGVLKTFLEHSKHSTSFVFTVVRENEAAAMERETEERRLKEMDQWESEHRVEGTQANFDRYIAGDR